MQAHQQFQELAVDASSSLHNRSNVLGSGDRRIKRDHDDPFPRRPIHIHCILLPTIIRKSLGCLADSTIGGNTWSATQAEPSAASKKDTSNTSKKDETHYHAENYLGPQENAEPRTPRRTAHLCEKRRETSQHCGRKPVEQPWLEQP